VQFLRNGGNLFALQKMLGHTTLDMVRRYVELASEDVENAHRSASPADNWNL
jgi:site-specific recombinase XerD